MRIKDILDAYRYIESKDPMSTKINNAIIEHSGGRLEEVPGYAKVEQEEWIYG